jgi:hypothetical protein
VRHRNPIGSKPRVVVDSHTVGTRAQIESVFQFVLQELSRRDVQLESSCRQATTLTRTYLASLDCLSFNHQSVPGVGLYQRFLLRVAAALGFFEFRLHQENKTVGYRHRMTVVEGGEEGGGRLRKKRRKVSCGLKGRSWLLRNQNAARYPCRAPHGGSG